MPPVRCRSPRSPTAPYSRRPCTWWCRRSSASMRSRRMCGTTSSGTRSKWAAGPVSTPMAGATGASTCTSCTSTSRRPPRRSGITSAACRGRSSRSGRTSCSEDGMRVPGRWVRAIAGVALALMLGAIPVVGAAPAPRKKKTPAPNLSAQIADQKRQIEAQQALIDTQRTMIVAQGALADSQAVQLASQTARVAALDSQLVVMKQRLETLESQANFPAWEDTLEKRLAKVEAATQKSPELPPDIVSAGDFPGSIRIPGSDAAIKFGARIRTAMVLTLDPLGTTDRFLTNSIPVGVPNTGDAKRTNISARASRLNLEFRTPGGAQEIRAFFEGDFAGQALTEGKPIDAFRLRHAYAQYRGLIVGQTWSTFSDPWVELEDLDFEGVSSENVIRQPQLRYWWTRDKNRLAVAIETPLVSISGGTGVNLFPDVVAREFFELSNGGHVQLAAVLRKIRGEGAPGDVRSTWAGGGSLTGVVKVQVQGLTDRAMFQVNGGTGIARYINDLNSAGGLDAAFDSTTGELKAIPAIGWYVGYEHRWKEWHRLQTMNLRSTVLWSLVNVHNYPFQPPDTYNVTNRFAVNLVFSPNGRIDAGIEYIYGKRENFDGQHADANQIQFVGLFRF